MHANDAIDELAKQTSDEALLSAYKSGSAKAFRVLVERYRVPLYNYLLRLLSDAHAAEDLFQEVFLSVHRSLDSFDTARRFRPWLYAIATNVGRDELRRRKGAAKMFADTSASVDGEGNWQDTLESPAVSAEMILNQSEQVDFVRQAFDRLPEALRTTLILFHYQELKYREIADVLEIPIGTVKSRLNAALTWIAEEYEKKFNRKMA